MRSKGLSLQCKPRIRELEEGECQRPIRSLSAGPVLPEEGLLRRVALPRELVRDGLRDRHGRGREGTPRLHEPPAGPEHGQSRQRGGCPALRGGVTPRSSTGDNEYRIFVSM